MKCYNCGSDIPEKSLFCGICGAKLTAEASLYNEETAVEDTETTEGQEEENIIDISETAAAGEETVTIDIESDVDADAEEIVIADSEADADADSDADSDAEEIVITNPEPVHESGELNNEEYEEVQAEPDEEADEYTIHDAGVFDDADGQADNAEDIAEFVIQNCPECGAVLMEGAKFCSNCGSSVMIQEQKKKKSLWPRALAVVLAAVIVSAIVGFTAVISRDIEGEWQVEYEGSSSIFSMFNTTYLDFDDDGTATYYQGFFTTREYDYTYNKFTGTLVLKSKSGNERSILHIGWINRDACVIKEFNMILNRIDDDGYDDFDDYYGEFGDDDGEIVEY